MKRTSIEEWVLKELWNAYPEGAAKNQLASKEMAEYIRRWDPPLHHSYSQRN